MEETPHPFQNSSKNPEMLHIRSWLQAVLKPCVTQSHCYCIMSLCDRRWLFSKVFHNYQAKSITLSLWIGPPGLGAAVLAAPGWPDYWGTGTASFSMTQTGWRLWMWLIGLTQSPGFGPHQWLGGTVLWYQHPGCGNRSRSGWRLCPEEFYVNLTQARIIWGKPQLRKCLQGGTCNMHL